MVAWCGYTIKVEIEVVSCAQIIKQVTLIDKSQEITLQMYVYINVALQFGFATWQKA